MSQWNRRIIGIELDEGSIPTVVQGPISFEGVPAVLVVPSVFGPTPELLERLAQLGTSALTCVPDPFWRTGEGALAYSDRDSVVARMSEFDVQQCRRDMGAVAAWAREHGNRTVIGLGICFGGPYVLRMAADHELDGLVTWHGSRMESALARAPDITCPVRHHLGSRDAMTPPTVVDALRAAFAGHPDAQIIVHNGADHGFTHDGPAWDGTAYAEAFASLQQMVER